MGHRSRIQVLHTDQIYRGAVLGTETLLEFELDVHLLKLKLIKTCRLPPVLLKSWSTTIFGLHLLNWLLCLSYDAKMSILADLRDPALEPRNEILARLGAPVASTCSSCWCLWSLRYFVISHLLIILVLLRQLVLRIRSSWSLRIGFL